MSQLNPAALPDGIVFSGRYRIARCIKAGGMGAVYECVHLTTEKHRALKVMLPQIIAKPGMRERFELEARVTAKIVSDHIVETFDAGIDETTGAPFLVMELLVGQDLDNVLQQRGPMGPDLVLLLLSQVALALEKTHAAGIVHRDLKPQNLFLTTRDDGSPRIKVLDFGIAKVVADGKVAAQQTAAIGTPLYMSPEQTTGDGTIGPPADLFALAHIAYTLLSGHPYWAVEEQSLPTYAFLSRMLAGPVEPPSVRAYRRGVALPQAIDGWFARATAYQPGQRFDRASTLVAELAAALDRPPQASFASASQAFAAAPFYPTNSATAPSGPIPYPSHVTPAHLNPSAPQTASGALSGSVQPPNTATPGPLATGTAPSASRRHGAHVAFLVSAVLFVAVGVGGVVLTAKRRGAAEGSSASSSAAAPPQPTSAPTASSEPVAIASAASASPSSANTSASATTAAVAASGDPSSSPGAKVFPPAKVPESPHGKHTGHGGPPTTGPAAHHGPDCSVPFTIDARGHHVPKPECI